VPELDFAFLCDYARPDAGIAHALAIGIDSIYASDVPSGRDLGLVARFTFTRNECGRPHHVEVIGQDADGGRVVNISATVEPTWNDALPMGWRTGVIFALNFAMPFPKFGLYAIELLINDSSVKSVNLRVVPSHEHIHGNGPGTLDN
jgi:hypothetical protein